jgi:hypothetical protein
LSQNFCVTGAAKTETRGGSRRTESQIEASASIVAFIKRLKVHDAHYKRGTSQRQYLNSELSIVQLYNAWKAERESAQMPILSKQTFANIFRTRFNLSFKNPSVDVCSTCTEYENKIKANVDVDVNTAELRAHKARADRFYQLLRESKNSRDVLTISFDMQKNMPLPKTNVTEAYYARQLWLYNLTIVIHSRTQQKKNVFMYTWLESGSGKGSNEVASILAHFFKKIVAKRIRRQRFREIHLFSDSCPAQNKNSTVLALLLSLANSKVLQRYVHRMKFIFPVHGHSYLPPDRVFGRVEKILRKHAVISTPELYYSVYRRYGRVFVYNQAWFVYDYKALAEQILTPNKDLKIRSTKIWSFPIRRNPRVVGVTRSYGGAPVPLQLLKADVNPQTLKPKLVPSRSHVSAAKKADVKSLLQFVPLTQEDTAFYDQELSKPCHRKKEESLNPILRPAKGSVKAVKTKKSANAKTFAKPKKV